MPVEITILDCTWLNPPVSSKIYCRLLAVSPISKTIGQTKSLLITNSVTWNESFQVNDDFTNQIKFILVSETIFEGENPICYFKFNISNSNKDQKVNCIQNKDKSIILTFSIRNYVNSPINSLPNLENHYPLTNYFAFSLQTEKNHKIALVHISSDKTIVQISTSNFSFFSNQSVVFHESLNTTSVLIDLNRVFNVFPYFFIVFQPFYDIQSMQNDRDSLSIIFQTGKDLTPFSEYKVQNLIPSTLYSLVYFEFHQEGTQFSVDFDSNTQRFSSTTLHDIFIQKSINLILKSRNFETKIYQTGAFNTGRIVFPDDLTVLRIFMLDSSSEKIDLSFTLLKENGDLSDTCFFNSPQILNNSIRLSTDQYHCYDTFSIIDFSQLPRKYQAIIITLTSFYEKPLSKIGSIQIVFTNLEETVLSIFPVTILEDKPGFILGYLKLIDNHHEFHYLGIPNDSKVPNLAAKAAIPILCPIEDDIEWEIEV